MTYSQATMTYKKESLETMSLDQVANLLSLQERLLGANNLAEVQDILIKDAISLLPSQRMVLFHQGKILAHSHLSDTSKETDYTIWVQKVFSYIDDNFILPSDNQKTINRKQSNRYKLLQNIIEKAITDTADQDNMDQLELEGGDDLSFIADSAQPIYAITANDLPKVLGIRQDWPKYWPASAVVLPLCSRREHMGYLTFLRDKNWSIESENKLLVHWAHLTAIVLRNHSRPLIDYGHLIQHWQAYFSKKS